MSRSGRTFGGNTRSLLRRAVVFADQEQSVARPDSSSSVFDRMILVLVVTTSLLAVAVLVSVLRTPPVPRPQSSPRQRWSMPALSEFAIEGTLTADPGPVQIEVTNDGTQIHNLVLVGGESTPDLDPGESATLDLGRAGGGDIHRVLLDRRSPRGRAWRPSWWWGATHHPRGTRDRDRDRGRGGGLLRPRHGDDRVDHGLPRRDRRQGQPAARAAKSSTTGPRGSS